MTKKQAQRFLKRFRQAYPNTHQTRKAVLGLSFQHAMRQLAQPRLTNSTGEA